jgi:hypothetical protein
MRDVPNEHERQGNRNGGQEDKQEDGDRTADIVPAWHHMPWRDRHRPDRSGKSVEVRCY